MWASPDSDNLAGMVIKWTPAPEILSVQKGSPADLAGCKPEARLTLVGGSSVWALFDVKHSDVSSFATRKTLCSLYVERAFEVEVTQLGRAGVLKLLAAEKNMILATWSPARLQELLRAIVRDPERDLTRLAELAASGSLDLLSMPGACLSRWSTGQSFSGHAGCGLR